MLLDKIITSEDLKELEQEKSEDMFQFDHFFGIDGELYYGQGHTLKSKFFNVLGVKSVAIPKGVSKEMLEKIITIPSVRESNAYVCEYQFTIQSGFNLFQHTPNSRPSICSNNDYNVFSVSYLKVDENQLRECRKNKEKS